MLKEELLKEFLGAHLTKANDKLIFDGDFSELSQTIDSGIANAWIDRLGDNVDFQTYTFSLYGDNVSITIPVFFVDETKNATDITQDYRLIVSDYLKDGLFSDRRGAIIYKLLESFYVYEDEGAVAFYPKTDMSDNIINTISNASVVNIGTLSTDIEINNLSDINKYENIILTFKEVSDGYYDVRRHSVVDKQQGKLVQQEYVLGRDIYAVVNTKTREVLEVTQKDTEYNSRKDKDSWKIISPDGTETEAKDFVPYKTETDGDITKIWMYGAYTHILRDLLSFRPLTWQYKVLLNQLRLSYVAGCRRSGKTRIMAYLIIRSLRRHPNSVKHVQRQIKSLYLAPSEDKQKEVVDYIKESGQRIRLLRVLDFNKKENRLYLYDEVVGRNQKVQNIVSNCDFVSAKGFEPGRGKASDEIFIDEGSIVDEDAFLNLLPIIGNERAKLFVAGTIDWKTRRQRFYRELIEAEKGIDPEMFGMRVTIDDLDDEHVPQIDKERMKRLLADNKDRYYAELYASFPDTNNVFNAEGFFNVTKDRQPFEKVGGYVIGYDPAKRSDIGAIEVGEYRLNSNGNSYIQLIEEYSLQGEYAQQKEVLSSIKHRYKTSGLGVPVYCVIDATQVGDVVAEMFGDLIDYKVRWTSKGVRPQIDAYGAWKVPKNHLVHLAQILIEKGLLKGWIGLQELISQLKNYKGVDTASGGVKYEAETGHDDHVSAMLLVGFYMGYIEGKVYEFGVGGDIIRPQGITEEGLYEEQTRRVRQLEEIIGKPFSFGL